MVKKFLTKKVVFPVKPKAPIRAQPTRVIKQKNKSVPLNPSIKALNADTIVKKRKRFGTFG